MPAMFSTLASTTSTLPGFNCRHAQKWSAGLASVDAPIRGAIHILVEGGIVIYWANNHHWVIVLRTWQIRLLPDFSRISD